MIGSTGEPALRYTRVAAVLHWVVAALIVVNLTLGLTADYLPDAWVRPVIDVHKSIGLTVLGLVLMRILWRLSHPPPPLPSSASRCDSTRHRQALPYRSPRWTPRSSV